MLKDIKELYKYREMLLNLVRKDLKTRYKGSALGFLWTFVNPLLQLIVYTIVFSTVMKINIENFSMFLFIGLIPWLFFQNSLLVGSGVIIANKSLVKKIYFPRVVLPLSTVTSGLINLLFSFIIVFIGLLISRIGISGSIIYLPLVIIVEYLLTLGVTFIVSALNVYFRDLEHILNALMMGWFYLTPIIYPLEMIPDRFMKYFFINPMAAIVIAYKDILYYGRIPNLIVLFISGVIGILLVLFGYNIFQKFQKSFAEEI